MKVLLTCEHGGNKIPARYRQDQRLARERVRPDHNNCAVGLFYVLVGEGSLRGPIRVDLPLRKKEDPRAEL